MALYNIADGDIMKAQSIRSMPRRVVYRWVIGALAIQQRKKSAETQERLEREAAELGQ